MPIVVDYWSSLARPIETEVSASESFMAKPKMDKETRKMLLDEIEKRIRFLEEKARAEKGVGWWTAKVSGTNDVYRFISSGEWET